MADFDLIREEGDGERTVLTVRVPDWVWDYEKPTGLHALEVLKVTKTREVSRVDS